MQTNKRYDNKSGWHGLYDLAQWKRTRKAQLTLHPLCVMCVKQGLTTLANIVDHITPHKGDTSLFFDSENLQSLCKLHHDSSKQSQERSGIERGHDSSGIPLDPKHHWNR